VLQPAPLPNAARASTFQPIDVSSSGPLRLEISRYSKAHAGVQALSLACKSGVARGACGLRPLRASSGGGSPRYPPQSRGASMPPLLSKRGHPCPRFIFHGLGFARLSILSTRHIVCRTAEPGIHARAHLRDKLRRPRREEKKESQNAPRQARRTRLLGLGAEPRPPSQHPRTRKNGSSDGNRRPNGRRKSPDVYKSAACGPVPAHV